MPNAEYLASVLQSYEDEIINEAYFLAVAGCLQNRIHRDKLTLLAHVERHAAAAILPLLERYELVPGELTALHALGQAEFAAEGPRNWRELLQRIVETYPKYVEQFRMLERIAPAEDRPALVKLTQHEMVTIDFARRELVGDSRSADVLHAYLEP